MTALPRGATIGIIGGGQLGRMLAMAAARLGYRTIILEPEVDCPAAQVSNHQIVGAYDDVSALDALAGRCDVVTYEFENVPVSAAEALARRVPVSPPPKALEISQDRLSEKLFLHGIGVPTARFQSIDSDAQLRSALQTFGGDGVLKTRRMGYDGKGQRVFRDADDKDCDGVYAAMGDVPLLLEELVPFEREISVIGARGVDGTVICCEPAENVHSDGILRSSTVPAIISSQSANLARDHAVAILTQLNYVGVIGVEFFVARGGKLIANEFAPRVHNSGHWTEAACTISQFELHIRAIAGLPMPPSIRHSDCVMENLIDDDVLRSAALLSEPDLLLHLYGKAEARPGRKMGHFTRISPRKD